MKRLFWAFLAPVLLLAEKIPEIPLEETPWLTGTLLAPFAYVIPPGYIDIEPFLFVTQDYGFYDRHWNAHKTPKELHVAPLLFLQMGLVKGVDFQIIPTIFYQQQQGQASTHFSDLPMGFDFQLLTEQKGKWWPAIKFSLIEIFPTGKYQHLDPKKNGTDITGGGAYVTEMALVFARLFHIKGHHFLNTYLTFEYFIPSNVPVRGFNTYGGGFGTKGTVRPGNSFITILSGEFTLTRHWALALDIQNVYSNKSSFSGKAGKNADGTVAKVGTPSFNEITLTPAIEYNFNSWFGIIGGAWFTAAGRNVPQFAGAAIAFNWYFKIY